jgi:serine/threonine protein kinase
MKILNNTEEEFKRVENESNLIDKLACENILKFVDSFSESMRFFLCAEYCDGGDLRNLIDYYKSTGIFLREEHIFNWTLQMFNALKTLHDRKIIHRDINPDNIFLSNDCIKVGGLGLATSFESFKKTVTIQTSYAYISPEVIQNSEYTINSDVWSAACVIYELIALEKVFKGKGQVEIFNSILNDEIPELPNSIFLRPLLNK